MAEPNPLVPSTIGQLYDYLKGVIGFDTESLNKNVSDVATNVQLGINSATVTTATNILRSTGQTQLNIASAQAAIQSSVTASQSLLQGSIASNSSAILLNLAGTKTDINNRVGQEAQAVRTEIGRVGALTAERVLGAVSNNTNVLNTAFNALKMGVEQSVGVISEKISGIAADVGDAIGDAIGGIGDFLDNFWSSIFVTIDQVGAKLNNFWSQLSSDLGADVGNHIDKLSAIVEKVKAGKYDSWQALERDLNNLNVNTNLITGVLSLLQIVPIFLNIGRATVQPFTDHIAQLANEQSRGNLLGAPDLITARIRGTTTLKHVNESLAKQGYTAEDIQLLIDTATNLLDEDTIRVLFLRDLITDEQHDNILRQLGYSNDSIMRLKLVYNILPPINDLIRFAVREVYSPETTTKFGQFEDFPAKFAEEANKQGLSTEQARNYWASHWELPSALQGFEMFHRRIIDESTLKLLLKALDVMPFWRDKLVQLSYNPLTRVDVRRMFGLGVLDREEVYNSYLDIGYSPTNANRLTEFTVRYETQDESSSQTELNNLTRGVIISGYSRKQLSRAEAKVRLKALRYVEDDAELLLDIADYTEYVKLNPDRAREQNERLSDITIASYRRKALSRDDAMENLLSSGYTSDDASRALDFAELEYTVTFKAEIVNRVKELYLTNTFTNNEVQAMLSQLDFTPPEIELFISELMVLKTVNVRKPTLAQFTSMIKKNIIDLEQYTSELIGLGYSDIYIQPLIDLALGIEGDD